MNARIALSMLLGAMVGGTWWIAAREVPAQILVTSLAGLAALFAAIGATRSEEKGRFSPMAAAILAMMLAFLGLQVAQVVNPAFLVKMDGLYWSRIPLPHSRLLPTGFQAPFDRLSRDDLSFTNPARHLLTFSGAFFATVAAFLATRRRTLCEGLVRIFTLHTLAISIVTIAHTLSGSWKALWFYQEAEFWKCTALFPYRNAAAAYQVLLFGMCAAGFRQERDSSEPRYVHLWFSAVACGACLVALLLLRSRAGVVMGAVLALSFGLQELFRLGADRSTASRATPRSLLTVLSITAIAASSLWILWRGGFSETVARFSREAESPLVMLRGGSPRLVKQQIALEMAKDHLWFGAGGGAYLYLFLDYHPRVPAYLTNLLAAQPDRNRIYETSVDGDWWEFLAEYGIVGTTLLAGSILSALLLWRRSGGQLFSASGYLASAAVLVTLHGFIDRTLREPIVLASLGVTLSLAIRSAQSAARTSRSRLRQETFTPRIEKPQSSASE